MPPANLPTAALFRCGLSFSSNIRTAGPRTGQELIPLRCPGSF
jgi:hypothetical protein